jgi:hypothetical protein
MSKGRSKQPQKLQSSSSFISSKTAAAYKQKLAKQKEM